MIVSLKEIFKAGPIKRKDVTGWDQSSGGHIEGGHYRSFKEFVRSHVEDNFGFTLNKDFLKPGNKYIGFAGATAKDIRLNCCYICGYKLFNSNSGIDPLFNTQMDHIAQYLPSSILQGHHRGITLAGTHACCNNFKDEDGSDIWGRGILELPYIESVNAGRGVHFNDWKINLKNLSSLNLDAKTNIERIFRLLRRTDHPKLILCDKQDITKTVLTKTVEDLNDISGYTLKFLNNPDFPFLTRMARTTIKGSIDRNSATVPKYKLIDKTIFKLYILTLMHNIKKDGPTGVKIDPGFDPMNDPHFKNCLKYILGPFYQEPVVSHRVRFTEPTEEFNQSDRERIEAFRARNSRFGLKLKKKFGLKRLKMDLKKLKAIKV